MMKLSEKVVRIFAVSMTLCMVLAFSGAIPAAESAANFPRQTIRVIVPFAAGGATDLMARVLVPEMSKRLGVDMIIENRAGGGGAPAINEMLRSAADGHTILLSSANAAVITPILSDVGYTNVDIAPIAQVSELPTNLFVKADSNIHSVADLMSMADAGNRVTYSTSGAGSIHHVVAELFQIEANKRGSLTHVPFNSGTESLTAVMGDHVNVAFANASYGETYAKQQGVLRVIATTAMDRDAILPETPTFRSLGYDVTLTSWFGFVARAGTPAAILDRLDEVVRDSMTEPELLKAFESLGQTANYVNRTDFTTRYVNQYAQLGTVLKEIFPPQ